MCIVVAKPAGVGIPSDAILSQCFSGNPHGAGIMYSKGGRVHWVKGLMTYPDFKRELYTITSQINSKITPMVFHFRIATHGAVDEKNCHPFPISPNYDTMRALRGSCKLALAHNGIVRITSSMSDIQEHGVSDTMAFIRHIVHPVVASHGGMLKFLDTFEIPQMVNAASGSKIAFLDGDGRLSVHGAFTEDGGVFYSNRSYKPEVMEWADYSDDPRYWGSYSKPAVKKAQSPIYNDQDFYDRGGSYIPVKYRIPGVDKPIGGKKL